MATRQRRLHVLLGGDTIAKWRSLPPAFQRRGHNSTTADNRDQVLAAFRAIPIDIVIMDLEVRGMEVFQLTRAIRSMPDRLTAETLLLVEQSEDWESGDERCLSAGVDWCFAPSISPAELVATAERLAFEYLPGNDSPQIASVGKTLAASAPIASEGDGAESCSAVMLERALPVFDQPQALHQCFGSEQILQQMAAYLLDHADRLLDEIAAAVRIGSKSSLRSTAHQLQGTVLHLGAPRAVLALKRLEQLPWSDEMTDAAAAVEEAARHVQRLQIAVSPLAQSAAMQPGQ